MRVLHVAAGNLFGGVETILSTLAHRREQCLEMTPHFALCFKGKLSLDLRPASVPVSILGQVRASRPWTVWQARGRMARLLRQTRFDVAICHSAWPHAVFGPVIKQSGVPLVTWLHDPARGTHWVERWARRTRPDYVICNSQFTAGTVDNLFPESRFEVVYCPLAAREHSTCDRSKVRSEMNTPASAIAIIQVSRLERWKGHLLHLEALGKLRPVPGWTAWFVGGAQRPAEVRYFEELKERAAQLNITDHVRFLGQRADVRQLLAAADIHCQPNIGPEPFGITFLEALDAGLPVVTTAQGGALEIVDQTCGILTPPGDAEALARSLRKLIESPDLRSHLGRAGPPRARALCDPARQMSRLYSLCQRITEQRRAA